MKIYNGKDTVGVFLNIEEVREAILFYLASAVTDKKIDSELLSTLETTNELFFSKTGEVVLSLKKSENRQSSYDQLFELESYTVNDFVKLSYKRDEHV